MMRDVSRIAEYGAISFAKARVERPHIRKQHAKDGFAFTVQPDGASKPLYLVTGRVQEFRDPSKPLKILADCVEAVTGARCLGFGLHSHCYHTAAILIHLKVCAQLTAPLNNPSPESEPSD